MSNNIPRDYVVTVEVTTTDKKPWDETMEVSAYELTEAMTTATVRLMFQHGEKIKIRLKDITPKIPHMGAILAQAMGPLGLKKDNK